MTKGATLAFRVIAGAFMLWMVYGLYRRGMDWAYPIALAGAIAAWIGMGRLRFFQKGKWAWIAGAVTFSVLFLATFYHALTTR